MVGAPRGRELRCRGWEQEGALRCLLNNLDPDVAENPEALVVYGGRGKAARDPEALAAIVAALERLGGDETLIVQSGKPVAVLPLTLTPRASSSRRRWSCLRGRTPRASAGSRTPA